jgi:ATP-dependent Clp protease ATP-binding subunit ClpB
VADRGYDPVYGARPLRRFLQRNVETRLARALITGEVPEGATVRFAIEQDALAMTVLPS